MAKRNVQAYIEEVPSWEGGIRLAGPPLSGMQWLDWSLATAGTFFEGLIVFMGVIALPLIAKQLGMSSADKGLVTAATLAGLLVSALALGAWPNGRPLWPQTGVHRRNGATGDGACGGSLQSRHQHPGCSSLCRGTGPSAPWPCRREAGGSPICSLANNDWLPWK